MTKQAKALLLRQKEPLIFPNPGAPRSRIKRLLVGWDGIHCSLDTLERIHCSLDGIHWKGYTARWTGYTGRDTLLVRVELEPPVRTFLHSKKTFTFQHLV